MEQDLRPRLPEDECPSSPAPPAAGGAEPAAEQAPAPEAGAEAPPPWKPPVERLYDKIPLSFRQVDILVKVLIAAFVLFLVFAVWQGQR